MLSIQTMKMFFLTVFLKNLLNYPKHHLKIILLIFSLHKRRNFKENMSIQIIIMKTNVFLTNVHLYLTDIT